MRRLLEETAGLRMLVGGPVALVTTHWRDHTDVMPAIWMTPLSYRPPLVGLAVNPARFTHEMIRYSEQFALNFPGRDLMDHSHYFGSVSGEDVDKLDISRLETFKASEIDAPLISNCIAWIECGVEDALRLGDHTLFVGRVLVVQAESDAFEEAWRLDETDYRPLHYLGGNRYSILQEARQAELRTTEEGEIELGETKEEREKREEEEAKERERRQSEGLDEMEAEE